MRNAWTKKHDNRGLTLVELLCSIAILSVLAAAVGSVLVVSAKNYQRGTSEINLQQEAQLTANQIADLIIDTTDPLQYDTATNTLTVNKAGVEYQVTYEAGEQKLYYSDGSDGTGRQLLAEYITRFQIALGAGDTSENKGGVQTLQLTLGLAKDSKTYESEYTITTRNGVTAVTGAEEAATINVAEDAIVLEPNQQYELVATVTGVADTAVVWTVAGNSSSDTRTYKDADGKWMIAVGSDETTADMVLLAKTNAKRSDGVTPLDQKTVALKIRRVTAISLSVTKLSGTELTNGAKYRIDVSYEGTWLDRQPWVSDNDYVDPRKVDWNTIYTIDGKEVGGATWESWRTPASQADCYVVSDETDSSLTITLKRDFDSTSQLTVTAVAKHPEGVDPVDSTIKTNKTGMAYDHVYATYTFQKSLINRTGAIIYRGSDVNQGSVDVGAVQAITNAMYNQLNYWNQNDIWRKYRYREVITDPDTGSVSYGPWTNWLFTTVEGGVSFNIRPADTKRFEPNKDYEVEFKFEAHKGGAIIWPTADTDPEAYSFRGRIDHTKLAFSFPDLGITGACGISKDSPMTVNRNVTYNINYYSVSDDVIGIKYDLFQNELQVRAEKLVDGVWVEATAADCNLYIQGNIGQQHSVTFYTAGTYRLETGLKNQTHRTGNFSSPTDTVQDYWLGNAANGDNYYYFNVN